MVKALKIDVSKLKTVANYATKIGRTPQRVYQLEDEDKIDIIKIDGVQFVQPRVDG
jgi:hypothetical protein